MKTKLGVSSELLAGIYFLMILSVCFVGSGAAGSSLFLYAAVVLGAYAMLKEDDLFLKASVIKGVLVLAFFTLIPVCLGFVYDIMDFINFFLRIAKTTPIQDGFGIISWLIMLCRIAEKVVFILLALFAFKRKTVKLPVIDSMINKHFN